MLTHNKLEKHLSQCRTGKDVCHQNKPCFLSNMNQEKIAMNWFLVSAFLHLKHACRNTFTHSSHFLLGEFKDEHGSKQLLNLLIFR